MIIYGYPEAAPYVPNKTNSHIAVETLGSSYQDSDGSSSYPWLWQWEWGAEPDYSYPTKKKSRKEEKKSYPRPLCAPLSTKMYPIGKISQFIKLRMVQYWLQMTSFSPKIKSSVNLKFSDQRQSIAPALPVFLHPRHLKKPPLPNCFKCHGLLERASCKPWLSLACCCTGSCCTHWRLAERPLLYRSDQKPPSCSCCLRFPCAAWQRTWSCVCPLFFCFK